MGDKSFLVLDIGTEAVKAGISQKTAIQYYDRFGVFDSRNFERDVIKKTILKAIEGLQSQAAKSVFLTLPPDVLRARVSLQSLEIKDPKKDAGQEIIEKNKKGVSEGFSQESGILPQEVEFLEQLFLERKIDGYPVPSFSGYRGKRAEAKILSVFSTKKDLKSYQEILKELQLEVLKIIHPAQQLTRVFNEKNSIFLDVGGEMTQVFVVKEGNLQGVSSFPMGGRDFSKELSETLGLQEERARILKERYSQGKMTEITRRKLNEIFSSVAQAWHRNLEIKLRDFRGLLPRKFFLFGGAVQLPEISEVLEEEYSLEIFKNPQEINLTLLLNAQKNF